jgi:hypothetical protein
MPANSGGSSEKLSLVRLTARQARALERIRSDLQGIGPCLPGSVVVRTGRCGKVSCSCHASPPRLHGPFRSWTRKVANKTVTRLLSEDQLADYEPLLENHRRLKALVKELEALGLSIVEADPRWKHQAASAPPGVGGGR